MTTTFACEHPGGLAADWLVCRAMLRICTCRDALIVRCNYCGDRIMKTLEAFGGAPSLEMAGEIVQETAPKISVLLRL